jgi:solute carrier family 35 protein E3
MLAKVPQELRAEWGLKQRRGRRAAPPWLLPVAYCALNIASASGIVFANKVVFQTYGFKFTTALTWIHTVFTLLGMRLFLLMGLFEAKTLPQAKLVPLAASYVAYIVLCNLSLNINTVGFYQV